MLRTLTALVTQVRGATLDLVRGVPDEWLRWAPDGTANHVLWHAGHALWVQDLLTLQPLTCRTFLPDGWAETFGEGSRPVAETTALPDRDRLAGLLEEQSTRVIDAFRQHEDDLLTDADRMSDENGWRLLPGIVHGWHDEARHQGEMYLLFKIQRAQRPLV